MAGAQAVDLGAHGLKLFLALLGGLRERLDAALVRLAPAGQQRLLLGDELRPGLRDFRLDHHFAARDLGLQTRRLDAPDLPVAGQLDQLGLRLLGIEAQKRRAGGDLLRPRRR